MRCSFPPSLTDDQLSAALDGTAEPAVVEHIGQCAACAARLEHARQIEASLTQQLYRFDCQPPQRLGEYHMGLISGTEERAIMRHLEQCALCRAELEDLRVFMADEVMAPQRATPETQPPQPRIRLGEVLARLLPRAPAMALRGAAAGPLMLEAGNATIVIDVQRGPQATTIMGQLAAEDDERWIGALVELRQGDRLAATTTIDDLGSFTLQADPSQSAAIRITPEHGAAIVIESIDPSA